MVTSLKYQNILFSLLNYYKYGNRPKFGEIVEKSLDHSGDSLLSKDIQWITFVTFNILKYVGVIDASETNISRWSYSLGSGCFVDGLSKYYIGDSKNIQGEFLENGHWKPFFKEDGRKKFCLHKFEGTFNNVPGFAEIGNPTYSSVFESRCPDWQQIESLCLSEDQWFPFMNGNEVEVFDFENSTWTTKLDTSVSERSLIRIPLEYSAREYRIVFPRKNRSVRVIYPEWAFLAAARLIGKKYPATFDVNDRSLSLSWNARLPAVIMRYLCSDEPDLISQYSLLKVNNVSQEKINFLKSKLDFVFKGQI